MNKFIIILLFACSPLLAEAFTGGGAYTLKGTTELKEGKAILRQAKRSDTVQILNGKFTFKGKIDKPSVALLELQPLGGIPVQVVLEPGQLTIAQKSNQFIVGGSSNNKRLQNILDQLAPFTKQMQTLRERSWELRGAEQKKLMMQIDSIGKLKVATASKIVKADSSFAGYLTMLSFYQRTSATEIKHFMQEFKAYSKEESYKQIEEHFASIPKADVGLTAPVFTLQNTEGKPVNLSDFRGKYVLLDFWFVDCGFCRQQAPGFVNIYKDLNKKNFEIIGISIDGLSQKQRWLDAIGHDKATWAQLLDYDKTLPGQYGVEGYPTMFLVSPDGVILQKIVGFHNEEKMRSVLAKFIK